MSPTPIQAALQAYGRDVWLERGIWGNLNLFPGYSHSYLAQEHTRLLFPLSELPGDEVHQ